MAIFNTIIDSYSDTNELDVAMESYGYPEESEVVAEDFVGEDICREFAEHAYKLEASTYIIDVALETAVLEGADVDTLTENALTDLLKKAQDGILKVWSKLQGWITKMKNKFRAFVNAKTKFVNQHKTSILNKFDAHAGTDSAFKYSGYEYPDSSIDEGTKAIEAAKNAARTAAKFTDTDEDMESVFSRIASAAGLKDNVSNIAALGAAITEKFRGREISQDEAKKSEVERWIKDVQDAKSTYTKITDAEAKAKKEVNEIIKNLKSAEKDAKKDKNKDGAAKIHKIVKYNNMVMSVVSKVTTVIINNYSAMFRQESACLKSIYGLSDKKAAKESTTVSESFNFFDSAYNTL